MAAERIKKEAMQAYERHSTTKLVTTVMALVVIAGIVVFVDNTSTDTSAHASSSQGAAIVASDNNARGSSGSGASATTNTSANNASSGYKNGTYSASSRYYVPNGSQSIAVSLTLKNGVISDASVNNSESDYTSAQYQQSFASIYKQYVVGQKLTNLRLGVIAGASDTTRGFIDALDQIASQAHA